MTDTLSAPLGADVDAAFRMEKFNLGNDYGDQASIVIVDELNKALLKFPWWPVSVYAANTILMEEVGEAAQACLDYRTGKGSIDDIIKEYAQCGAMCHRAIQHLYVIKSDEARKNTDAITIGESGEVNTDPSAV